MQEDAHAGTPDFDTLWYLQAGWFEAPNIHRQGWSGVSRIPIADSSNAAGFHAFLKRQQNFMRRTWRHPVIGVPTFRCEYAMLLHLQQHGIPVPVPLFFSEKKLDGNTNAVLLTVELQGYVSLDAVLAWLSAEEWPLSRQRKLIKSIARTVATLHAHKVQHRALYPKHIFIREQPQGEFDSVLIDLEKARFKWFSWQCTLHDLTTLNRDTPQLGLRQRLYFLHQYYQVGKLGQFSRWMAQRITSRTLRKQKH
ncbi:Lipopolysaccharide kinase (Kdo/WaaP) family protein [Methylobacillus rhizosphaerae]|uniref:Lipopolysaccharide kinase (Kdo/WaaP) family protein n=1 Tax=Methylobacillus rhizosphaerae TaxID=551994 RepID=A0A238ZKN1_9PROT|nr:lipopolysaccharide kinase InaA family protein [Methylobacillus rhizosphaerae]SNR84006.1 Lipopolysaccharide kinase (Kdo/WaaP) family protein [Methylobacillus rhizosphaerae]